MRLALAQRVAPAAQPSFRDLNVQMAGETDLNRLFLDIAITGQAWRIAELLDRGADLEARLPSGSTALHLAAQAGHMGMVDLLLDRGADIEGANSAGSTPLHRAAWAGRAQAVMRLVDRGARVDPTDTQGRTPLRVAVEHREWSTVRFLIALGARADLWERLPANPSDVVGSEIDRLLQIDPLMAAVETRRLEVVALAVKKNTQEANIDHETSRLRAAARYAAEIGPSEAGAYLQAVLASRAIESTKTQAMALQPL